MKRKYLYWFMFAILLLGLGMCHQNVSAETAIEEFMRGFEAEYSRELGGVIDSSNPYAKSVRMMKTTPNGFVVMLDKVLVTEDLLSVSFLIAGDFPENPCDVQLSFAGLRADPILPYPPDSFEVNLGGGGGGGPNLRIVHENPTVILDTYSIPLMYMNGYISPSDPIDVKVDVPMVTICWELPTNQNYTDSKCYYEEVNFHFNFTTNGAELAKLTKTIEINHTFSFDDHEFRFDRLRFNPMHLILFTGKYTYSVDGLWGKGISHLNAITDNGTIVEMNQNYTPYYGFTRFILDPELIHALEMTKTLKIVPCMIVRTPEELGHFPDRYDPEDYDCSEEHAFTVSIL